MSNYVTLLGTEDVSKAGHNMERAAADMNRAASSMEDSLHRQRLFMEQWLQDLERVLSGYKQ